MKFSTSILPMLAVPATVSGTPVPPGPLDQTIQAMISRQNLEAKVQELYAIAQRNNGNRASATKGHYETVDWIEKYIPKEYFNIERQYFNFTRMVYDGDSLIVDGKPLAQVVGFANGGRNGTVTAPLIKISNFGCNATDYPAAAAGKVAFVKRGACELGFKAAQASKAGVAGLIVQHDQPELPKESNGELGRPWVGAPHFYNAAEFPITVVISKEEGDALMDRQERNASKKGSMLEANVTLTSLIRNDTQLIPNLIATTKGGNQNAIITIGVHTDSVIDGPGINDDGSGIIAAIEVLRALATTKSSVNNALRFCFWAGEEDGLLGSSYYVDHLSDKEAAKIVMNLNFDMIASPNYVWMVYDGDASDYSSEFASPANGLVEKEFKEYFKTIGIDTIPREFNGRSDFASFLMRGIPSGGIFTGGDDIKTEEQKKNFGGTAGEFLDRCYHQACDGPANLNYDAFVTGTKAMAYLATKFGQSIKTFPFPRSTSPSTPKLKG
ncbi:Leucyl aminopeptidase yscIV [Orbilia ellipsospora]|uniref:Peptide hydrolase n=1 Tax=Orbilia ellipsospora TaxID=2528407 RepID=A0AAV9X4B2_9PEZI